MTGRTVDEVKLDLQTIETEFISKAQQELEINHQIAELRRRLSEINAEKHRIRNQKASLDRELASAERQAELRREQESIEQRLEKLREEADELTKDAPWRGKIFDWQFDGAIRLASAGRAILGDRRGMGKTLSAIAWRRTVKSKKTLYLTRKSYAEDSVREITTWEPGVPVIPLISPAPSIRKTMISLLSKYEDLIVVANFEQWRRSIKEVIKDFISMGFDGIILDEAHQLKTFNSATTKGFVELAHATPRLLEMTGSPVQNRPQELFAILHCAYPDLFPRPADFVRDYCIQLDQNRWTWAPGGLDALMKKMSGFFIARSPEDVGHKIPPPAIHEYELDFEGYEEQREAYRAVAEDCLLRLRSGQAKEIPSILAMMTRQAQITSWPAGIQWIDPFTGEMQRYDVHQSVKLDWAEDLIKELIEEEHRVVLFSRFVAPVVEIWGRLNDAGISTAMLTGESQSYYKREVLYDFDLKTAPTKPRFKTGVFTYDTVGEAVNLNAARHLLQLDRYWKPSKDDQAIGRIDRINSTDQATVHRAHVKDTIDTYMIELIEDKSKMLSQFKGAHELRNDYMAALERSLQ